MDIAAFRAAFPEFTDVLFPDASVIFWSDLAATQISADVWGTAYTNGLYLLTAHYLTMSKISASGVTSGNSGVISQKKVGDVSVSYDATIANASGAGLFNRTSYGQQYWTLVQMFGVGAVQL